MITVYLLDAVKVQFLKPLDEYDFVESGMKAWLTHIQWNEKNECYELFFNFTEFEKENSVYFLESYFANEKTGFSKSFYTAIEAGVYTPKHSNLFWLPGNTRDDEHFEKEILQYLKVVE